MTDKLMRVLHPTDFSRGGAAAFAHALWMTLAAKGRLFLLHVDTRRTGSEHWADFPHVRETVARWGLIDPGLSPQAMDEKLGIHVAKVSIAAPSVRDGVSRYAIDHRADLMVLSTHDRHGLNRWMEGSVAEDIARTIPAPTLFVPENATGLFDVATGRGTPARVLVPIDGQVNSASALRRIESVVKLVAADARVTFLHVGDAAPRPRGPDGAELNLPIVLRTGPVVDTIISYADEIGAGLIAMPTEGRQGFLDALRGSTTERVVRHARRPVLAAPVG